MMTECDSFQVMALALVKLYPILSGFSLPATSPDFPRSSELGRFRGQNHVDRQLSCDLNGKVTPARQHHDWE